MAAIFKVALLPGVRVRGGTTTAMIRKRRSSEGDVAAIFKVALLPGVRVRGGTTTAMIRKRSSEGDVATTFKVALLPGVRVRGGTTTAMIRKRRSSEESCDSEDIHWGCLSSVSCELYIKLIMCCMCLFCLLAQKFFFVAHIVCNLQLMSSSGPSGSGPAGPSPVFTRSVHRGCGRHFKRSGRGASLQGRDHHHYH